MTAAAVKPPFADASPAEIHAALLPEDQLDFDRQWRAALAEAAETLSLDEVYKTLECWRRVAWMTTAHGPETHRRMLAEADHTLRTAERPSGSVAWSRLKAELGL